MIGVLLLAQWLVAAYACPVVGQAIAAGAEPVVAPAPMANCHGGTPALMDPANPSLCKVHCTGEQTAPAHFAADDAPVQALVWFTVPAFDLPEMSGQPEHRPAVPRSGAPPGWPALHLIHGVLRN